MKKGKLIPKKDPQLSSILEKLSRPKQAWETYLRQKSSGERFSLETLIESAQDMEEGGDFKARYCAAMAYAEAGMRLNEGFYVDDLSLESTCRSYGEKSRLLLISSINQAESLKDYLDINLRKNCLDLYKIPIWARIYNLQSVYDAQKRVTDKLEKEILAFNTILSNGPVNDTERAWLTGAANEYSVLLALQSSNLLEKGLLAIPSFPWEEDGIENTTLHTKIVRQPQNGGKFKQNTNYDISIINLFDPRNIIKKIQVKTSGNFTKFYDESINLINSSEIVQELNNNAPAQHRYSNLLSFYIYRQDDGQSAEKIAKVNDTILHKIGIN